ncbi:MAG: alpha/beta hydrolase [Burkholderiales bacterium]|nr:alpha/beta hydrolase [Burkholderiales bacterium]
MKWAKTADGTDIYYEDTGGPGPVIVFQSGFMGIHEIWKYQVEALRHVYRCVTHDNRGHGLSSHPEDVASYSTERNAEDLKAVIDDTGINEPFLLISHSMGSANSVAFTIKYPYLVKAIVMISGSSISGDVIIKRGGHEEMFSVHHTSPSASMKFFNNLGLENEIAIEAGKWPRYVFRNQTAALLNYRPGAAVSKITVPVLILHGANDVVAPLKVPEGNVAMLPNARLQSLDGVNHFPQTEDPETVNRIIEEFIRENGMI